VLLWLELQDDLGIVQLVPSQRLGIWDGRGLNQSVLPTFPCSHPNTMRLRDFIWLYLVKC
jgi:hypothetical protein